MTNTGSDDNSDAKMDEASDGFPLDVSGVLDMIVRKVERLRIIT